MKSADEAEAQTSPSTWRLLGCENGLRFFQEVPAAKRPSGILSAKQLSVVKCIGTVNASPETACSLLLDYGPARAMWDATVESAHVLEVKDGKTDVLQLALRSSSPTCWNRPKLLLLLRWWSKHTDGSYVIFFKSLPVHSFLPQQCIPTPSSWLECGAYIVRPVGPAGAQGSSERSVVELAIESEEANWPSWLRSCCCCSGIDPSADVLSASPPHTDCSLCSCFCCCTSSRSGVALRRAMFHSIAGLREYCNASPGGVTLVPPAPVVVRARQEASPPTSHRGVSQEAEAGDLRTPLLRKVDSVEAFEDCGVESLSDHASEFSDGTVVGVATHGSIRVPMPLARPAPESDLAELQEFDWETFHGSVPRGRQGEADCKNCWATPDDTSFFVRGESFYKDGGKAVAGRPLCRLVAVDWFHSQEPIREIGRRKEGFLQRVREHYQGKAPFFIALNLQVPAGSKDHYSLVFYFAVAPGSEALSPGTLLHRFVKSDDDDFRRERLTLIPAVPQGSWLVRNAVGSARFVMLAQVLETSFHGGEGFFEIDVNMGTSSVVRGIVGLVIPCMSMLTVDMAFLLKAEKDDPLPEEIFGAVRCCSLELGSAVEPPEQ